MPNFYTDRNNTFPVIAIIFSILIFSNRSLSQPMLSLTPAVTGLSGPMQLVNAGDGTNRFFVPERGGSILVYDQSWNSLGTFLDISADISTDGERGLLSMAFSPNYPVNGFFFLYYTNTAGDLEVARYHVTADPNEADPLTKAVVLTIPHSTNNNHNGGTLNFGSDGNLYLSTGDGGGASDVPNNAQNTSVLLGKILRFTVNTSATAPYYSVPADNPFGNEVWALGLRNPFRWSFDSQTGDMWIGDVGQGAWEEIDHTVAGTPGGVNYGWRCYEGNEIYNDIGCSGTYTFPVYAYPNPNGSAAPASAVTGGTVYRGTLTANTALQGYYLFADFFSGDIYKMRSDGTVFVENAALTNIANFGVAENGELYAVSLGGTIYSINVSSVLPLTLSQFTGTSHNGVIQLNWKTSSEQDVRQFEVEYSTDGNNFTRVGTVPAKNSSSGAEYQFNHAANQSPVYYRLKMVDLDGNYRYSNVIVITLDKIKANFAYPTVITTGVLNLLLNEPFNSVELVSMNGSVLWKMDITGRIGNFSVPVHAAAGTYIVQLKNREKKLLQRIIIR